MTPDETARFDRNVAMMAGVLGYCFRTDAEASDAALECLLEKASETERAIITAAWGLMRLRREIAARNLIVPEYSLPV